MDRFFGFKIRNVLYLFSILIVTTNCIPIDNGLILKPRILSDAKPARTVTECSEIGAADVVTVIDGSTSIGEDNFQLLRNFLAETANQLPEESLHASVEFSGHPVLLWGFGTYTRKSDVVEAFRNIKYIRGTTKIGAALQFVIDKVIFDGNRPEFPDTVVVITDGRSSDDPSIPAKEIRDMGISVVAMGITQSVDERQLLAIAGHDDRVVKVENFQELNDQAREALLGTTQTCKTIEIFEDAVLSDPSLDIGCNPDSIYVGADTKHAFEGRVYVKGHSDQAQCVSTGDSTTPFADITIPFDQCGTSRTRSLEPRGIFVENTVIFSFHKTFETKVDRIFKVRCFYMEADKTVTSSIIVDDLTTSQVTSVFPMPVCTYTLHADSVNGPPVRFAIVGQSIFHKWHCDNTQSEQLFQMRVHSCYVDDGNGHTVQLLDIDGCAIDINLLSNLDYQPNEMLAFVESHAFKYPDQINQYYQCQIELCVDEEGGCQNTPPVCSDRNRFRRSAIKMEKDFPKSSENETANHKNYLSNEEKFSEKFRSLDVSTDEVMIVDATEVWADSNSLGFENQNDIHGNLTIRDESWPNYEILTEHFVPNGCFSAADSFLMVSVLFGCLIMMTSFSILVMIRLK